MWLLSLVRLLGEALEQGECVFDRCFLLRLSGPGHQIARLDALEEQGCRTGNGAFNPERWVERTVLVHIGDPEAQLLLGHAMAYLADRAAEAQR